MGVTLGVLRERRRLVGRRRRHDLRRRRTEAADQRHRVRKTTFWEAGISAAAMARSRFGHPMYGAPLIVECRAHRRPLLLLPLARRQSRHLRALFETHHRARPCQRPRRQFLLGGLLVSVRALHRFPGAAPARNAYPARSHRLRMSAPAKDEGLLGNSQSNRRVTRRLPACSHPRSVHSALRGLRPNSMCRRMAGIQTGPRSWLKARLVSCCRSKVA